MSVGRPWTEHEERLLAGGLPDSSERRLAELRGAGMTSSFLRVTDEAIAAMDGVQPVAQVIGASACRLGVGVVRRTRGPAVGTPVWREHEGPIRSWSEARRRALARLSDQARRLEADAVLGVRPRYSVGETEPRSVEVVLTGTAVRFARSRPNRAEPVLGLVSPQELALLGRAGVEVLGIVGSCSAVELGNVTRAVARGGWLSEPGNYELKEVTVGMYEARRLAVERLRAQARQLGASGVIGVDLAGGLLDEADALRGAGSVVHLLGTAVRRTGRHALSPTLTLSLGD